MNQFIVITVVSHHDGRLRFETKAGQGATFILCLLRAGVSGKEPHEM